MIAEQQDLVQQFLACRQRLLGFFVVLTRDYHVAEELVQELYLEVERENARGTSPADPFVWFMGVARHRAADYYRARARDAEVAQRLSELADAASQAFVEQQVNEDASATETRTQHLRACMEKLTANTRSILEARYTRSQKIDQIAAAMAWKAASVKVALAKARRLLAECVARKLRAGGSA